MSDAESKVQGMAEEPSAKADQEREEVHATRLELTHERREQLRLEGALKTQRARERAEKFITRCLSGLVYVIVVLACLFAGKTPTAVLVAAMSWMCASELMHIMRLSGRTPNEFIGLAAAVAFPISSLMPNYYTSLVWLALAATSALWYIGIPKINILDVAVTIFVSLYTGLLISSLVTIRAFDPGFKGAFLTLAVFGCIWANDSLAFVFGSMFGKHKMAPRISPKKSWEGFAGGMVGSVLVWIVVYFTHFYDLSLPVCLAAGILIGVSGVLGDLFESRIKRGVGIKDSGDIMPGHGGLLDRCDSLLFGCVAAELILTIGGIL